MAAACAAAPRFDPSRTSGIYGRNGGRHFDSWICDLMHHRCTDWLRSKGEGNGDSRYNNHNRVSLVAEFDDEPDVGVELERYLSDDRVAEWTAAAALVGLPLPEFIVVSLDRAALAVKRADSAESSTPTPRLNASEPHRLATRSSSSG